MGAPPLWQASYVGHYAVVKWLIASGRDLADFKKGNDGSIDADDYTALEIAREKHRPEVVSLLERFMANPVQTRHKVRVELGLLDALAAEVFALTVFLCDDLLHLKPALIFSNPAAASEAFRFFFFGIARRLPMELQMILCHRVVGSVKESILTKDSEAAFKSLARILEAFLY